MSNCRSYQWSSVEFMTSEEVLTYFVVWSSNCGGEGKVSRHAVDNNQVVRAASTEVYQHLHSLETSPGLQLATILSHVVRHVM